MMIDVAIDNQKPLFDELEITLIGAGSNAGESVVVHIADNKWMIIDSCKYSGEILPLYYLHKKEVCLDNVIFVVCTHWHTDHVRGMSEVISQCPNAKFVMPAFSDKKKVFETLFKESISNQSPIARELHGCLKAIRDRQGGLNRPMYLGPRDDIRTIPYNGVNVELRSFSPSDHAKELYDQLLAQSTFQEMAETELETNMCSSVIDITTDNQLLNILLGADLECNRDDLTNLDCKNKCEECSSMGWCNVIFESEKYKQRKKYNYIKAAHHSSVNGYCPSLMDEKVDKTTTIITTTIFKNGAGVRLPQQDMMTLYLSKVDNYFITASRSKQLPVKDTKSEIESMRHEGVECVKVVEDHCGMITSRYNINTGQLVTHQLWGDARKVDETLIQNFG